LLLSQKNKPTNQEDNGSHAAAIPSFTGGIPPAVAAGGFGACFFLGLRDARSVVGVVVEIYLSQQKT